MGFTMKRVLVLIIASMLLVGCASTGEDNGRVGGALLGAAVGALLGNALDCKGCALIGGTTGAFIGGTTGAQIGRRMDEVDAMKARNAIEYNTTGQRSTWVNPDNQTTYDVTPVRTVRTNEGPCREVRFGEARVGEQRQEVYSTACRQLDGTWKLQ